MRQEIPARLNTLVSQCFPGWKVEECIGEGSYSRVYRIRQKDAVGSDSALKWVEYTRDSQGIAQILQRGASDKDVEEFLSLAKTQLQREIQLMDKLRGNSYIVNMDDHQIVDREDGGFDLLIRMEYLTPLPALTKEMTVQDAAQVGMDICSALIDCEKEGIAHRDIKPANIFRNRQGRYKLGDFGVAKQIGSQKESSPQGTPLYMAPEVYASKPYDGKKADTYSLGLVLYELLNAQHPPFTPLYNCPPTVEQEEESVRVRVGGRDLPSPRQGTPGLNLVISRACSFDPEDRYDSAEEMLRELQGVNLSVAGQEKLQSLDQLPPPPQPVAPQAAPRDPRQDSKLTEKSSPSDTNPLAASLEGAEQGNKRRHPILSAEEEEGDEPDAAPKNQGSTFSVGDVIKENEQSKEKKKKKRKKQMTALIAAAAVLLVAAAVILVIVLQGRLGGLTFVQRGTEGEVAWTGGRGPWQVSVLLGETVLREEQVSERKAVFQLAPGYNYTIRVADQTVDAPMKELPSYAGNDIAIQRVRLQYYRVKADGAAGALNDTDMILYSPLIGSEGERGYLLRISYKKPAGEDAQAVCFLLAEDYQDTKAVRFTTSEWLHFEDIDLNETLTTHGGSGDDLIYKIYADDKLLAQGTCAIGKE